MFVNQKVESRESGAKKDTRPAIEDGPTARRAGGHLSFILNGLRYQWATMPTLVAGGYSTPNSERLFWTVDLQICDKFE